MATAYDNNTQRSTTFKEIAKQSFLTLATSSAENRPHVAGLVYAEVDGIFYLNTHEMSVKARNIQQNPRVAATIPVRKYPIGPPLTIQFQGTAELRANDHPTIQRLLQAGKLKAITSHGELDNPGGCFIEVVPNGRMVTYGIGVGMLALMRDPLNGIRTVRL